MALIMAGPRRCASRKTPQPSRHDGPRLLPVVVPTTHHSIITTDSGQQPLSSHHLLRIVCLPTISCSPEGDAIPPKTRRPQRQTGTPTLSPPKNNPHPRDAAAVVGSAAAAGGDRRPPAPCQPQSSLSPARGTNAAAIVRVCGILRLMRRIIHQLEKQALVPHDRQTDPKSLICLFWAQAPAARRHRSWRFLPPRT